MSGNRGGRNFKHRGYPHKHQFAGYGDYDFTVNGVNEKGQRHENRGGNSQGGKTGRGGHPPGLKGKAIGLFYRNQAMMKKATMGEKSLNFNEPHYYSIDPTTEEIIVDLLRGSYKEDVSNDAKDSKDTVSNENDVENITKNYGHIKESQFKKKFLDIISGSIQEKLAQSMSLTPSFIKNDKLDKLLKEEQANREKSSRYQNMMEFRSKLPSFKMKDEILNIIDKNQVVVISGETGCGKTTQIPQFILDDAIEHDRGSVTKVICTQPRRISAISVAERVAAERGESLGKSVGYQIRLEKILSRDYGSILFCTTGLLLQFMQSNPALKGYSHIILDEIHERNTESDFIITLLKQVIPKRPDLKVILMSATLNAETFSKYYENCPNIHIPGFTFPVDEYYLEDIIKWTRYKFPPPQKMPVNYKKHLKNFKDMQENSKTFSEFIEPALRQMEAEKIYPYWVINELRNPNSEKLSLELIQQLLEYICECKDPGAVLVFLPGLMDISNLSKNLLSSGRFPPHKYAIYPLHSRLPTTDQKLIFEKPPPGVRKIIIATSIAETSITIEDVVYVVDCGKMKLARFDVIKNIETLEPEWISLANAKQRRGRAGRVKPGECYRLYTRAREMTFDQYPTPEMLRTPLEEVILQAKILQLGRIDVFLGSVLDPPTDRAIELSLELLRTLNAIDSKECLTPLGYHLACLPLDPRTGKMIIWAAMFSCVEPVFAIAASLSFKDAFHAPLGNTDKVDKAKLELGLGHFSDHIALAEALRRFEASSSYREAHRFCSDNFLSWNTLKLLSEMKQQFAKHLCEMKFLDSDNPSDKRSNRNSNNVALIKAIVCAGLFPNIAVAHGQNFQTSEGEIVKIHPSSINQKQKSLPTPYVTYYLKQKSTAIFLHDTTCVNEGALIFAAPKSSIKSQGGRTIIVLHKSLSFRCKQSTARIIQKLHEEFDKLVEHKISHPGTVRWGSEEGDVIRAIIELIS
ncbi:hypothetical protein PV328_005512 [Microctonus aethiopoides]|uniref:RNA helicase n=1 Tax=Microctonus aethiopoides TaxID=144406 RepID=A0AA39FM43_9HYME|nr:hypothetical protein PV328_005512 [Microctonus aethiopoides]